MRLARRWCARRANLNFSHRFCLEGIPCRSFSKQQDVAKDKKKKKKKGGGQRVDAEKLEPHILQGLSDLFRPETEEEKWFEDRTPEQIAMDTEYYKEIQRRQMREIRRVDKQLSRKIKAKKAALKALPKRMLKEALVPNKEPFPYEVGPWNETPPIKGFDPTKTLAFKIQSKREKSR
mmetsp:Transcript_13747/g.20756  ORF Transcript_13747/g.20756 Transcript_13747/m.20756 type:complete len:177 (+) Transcript_13747:20-550(+)